MVNEVLHSSFLIYFVYCSISGSASELSTSVHSIGLIFSCRYWNATNRAGTIKICRIIPINIPPMAEVPSVRLPLAPAPDASINGIKPTIMASDVIKIGRRRAAVAAQYSCPRYTHTHLTTVEGKLNNQDSILRQ